MECNRTGIEKDHKRVWEFEKKRERERIGKRQ